HHRRLMRRRQRHARFLHRTRRHGPADQHSARRGHRRRRRRRHVRHAALRHHCDLRRRPDGRPHARIRRQEDRSEGSQDGDARHPRPAADVSRLDRGRHAGAVRRRRHGKSWAARLHRSAVRLRLAGRQQRFRLRRAWRHHAVLQSQRRRRDVCRPLLDDHPNDGDCRLARRQENRTRIGRYVPDYWWPFRRPGRRRDRHRRRPYLLPGARAWTAGRAARDQRRHSVFSKLGSESNSMETSQLRKSMPISALFDPKIVLPAIGSAFVKLNPWTLMTNPVMFVLEIVTALTTVILIRDLLTFIPNGFIGGWVRYFLTLLHANSTGGEHIGFEFQIILWLWFTVVFANFAEAVAEGRGKAQAETLRRQRTETQAKLVTGSGDSQSYRRMPSTDLKVGNIVLVEAGDIIPSDGEVIEGMASINEA